MDISQDKVVADRLVLISDIEWLRLDEPAFIRAGETYWFDAESNSLMIENAEGVVRTHPARWPGGPEARR